MEKHVKDLTLEQAGEEAEKLREEINRHNYYYYALDSPIISDAAFDRLMRRLEAIEERFPSLISASSPTQRIGAEPLKEFGAITHTIPMLSLNNAFSANEALKFDERIKKLLKTADEIEYVVEPKIDGLAIECVYENGVFARGGTRGDGVTGEDVTQNLKTIKSIPLKLTPQKKGLKAPSLLDVRGEAYLPAKGFKAVNRERGEKGEPLFANPRNAAAGSLRQLDPRVTALRPLDCFFYGVGGIKDAPPPKTHIATLEYIKTLGIKTNPLVEVVKGIHAALKYHEKIERLRETLGYEVDGVVIKVNDLELQQRLGVITRSPRWALAYKFKPKEETTIIKDILVGVGRTGALTPVASLEPVEVGGVIVERATLHNQDEIDRKDVRVGDTVVVKRAGDVIPEVSSVIRDKRTGAEKPFKMPRKCPECGSTVERIGAIHFCMAGLSCPAQLKEGIRHFASKRAMDIEGLGEKHVELFTWEGLLKDVSDIYKIKKEDLTTLERWAEKSAENLIAAIEKSKRPSLEKFIYSLGIPGVGEHTAVVLARKFCNLSSLAAASYEELISIHEIGPETARAIRDFFTEHHNLKVMEKLKDAGVRPLEKEHKKGRFEGKTFLFTGGLESFTREEGKRLVENEGGLTAASVSRRVDYVVAGIEPGSKFDKAKKLGLKIISEEEFKKMSGR